MTMDALATQDIRHDRGLGSAYERYCFYQLVDAWAARYGVETALEGPIDGMAGVSGVHLAGLARRGVRVVSVLPTKEKGDSARAVYAAAVGHGGEASAGRAGGGADAADVVSVANADVRVVDDPMRALRSGELPASDMIIAYHALSLVPDWRAYLGAVAKLAKKVLIVTTCNPKNWGVEAIRVAARLRGVKGMDPPEVWKKEVLGPALWELGRVREHVYFDCPWWPDLQVSAGQSLADRAKQLFSRGKAPLEFTASAEGVKLAERFVYGAERWPYFGGDGWVDELLPALLRHPCFDGAKMKLLPRVAHLHAFVVDMRPHTPQGRRKLAVAG